MSSQTAVAKDPQTRRVACETIFDCDIFLALNEIIFNGETSRIRWQAAVLMKLLAMYGPTRHVCNAMRAKHCLDALNVLRNVQHCREVSLSRLSTCIAVILCYISCNFVSTFGA
jgi:hypothetical protein